MAKTFIAKVKRFTWYSNTETDTETEAQILKFLTELSPDQIISVSSPSTRITEVWYWGYADSEMERT